MLDAAELVIYLLDGEAGITAEDLSVIAELEQKPAPHLVLWNKADIAPMPQQPAPAAFIRVSAKTGEGVADLTKAIAAAVEARAGVDGAADSQTAAIGSERQKNLVEAAAAAVDEALLLAGREEPLDIIAPLLREAVNALGEITGEVSTADILEEMFSRFCVGK